jgi:Ca-activated chloride channel homolog
MGILAPLALITLPLLGVIVALYLLKLRRPVAPVGSLHLWESLTRDREANSLWQRLRVSVLLVLQLIVLGALILALARPWVAASEPLGRNLIIVVDVSASMASTDVKGLGTRSRLQAAKDRAVSLIDGLPQDGTAALISSDNHASLLVPPTSDKARLRDAVNALTPRPSTTDMDEAMKLAGVLSARQPGSSLWVLSDGDFPPVTDAEQKIEGPVHFVPFGTGNNNSGISALTLQQQAGNLQLFAQVVSAASVTVTRRIDFTVDDQPWTAKSVEIGPQGSQEIVLDDVPLQARVISAQMADVDALELDDKAWVINRASVPANVLLVTGGDKFAELALSLLPNVNLYKVAPGDYRPNAQLSGSPPDLTIFDAVVPVDLTRTAPPGSLLFIAPPSGNGVITVTGTISQPVPALAGAGTAIESSASSQDQSSRDPLLRYVDLSGMHIAKAQRMELPSWAHTILGSDQGPLIVAGENAGRKVAALAFDIHDTDLPLQTAFPLLIRNIVTSLLPDPAGGLPITVDPGTTVGIDAIDSKVDKISVEDPSAKEWAYDTGKQGRVAFAQTGQLGVYYVSQYAGADLVGQEAFAVNLFARDESMIGPVLSPGLPTGTEAASGGQGTGAQDASGEFKREIWPIVALIGLLVLLAEWGYAQRVVIRRALLEWRAKRKSANALKAE